MVVTRGLPSSQQGPFAKAGCAFQQAMCGAGICCGRLLENLGVPMAASVPEPSFSGLVHLLAEQALLAMGVPHPELKDPPPANPIVARFYVDLLSILQDKTKGSLTSGEATELEEVLYQLRMRALHLQPAPADSNLAASGISPRT